MPQEDWREQVRLLTMEEFKNLQPGRFGYHLARRPRCAEAVPAQYPAVGNAELNHEFFFGIVCDECYIH